VYASVDDARAMTVAKQNACMGCHAVDKKIVGPGFQAVAKKYAHDPGAIVFLKNKIMPSGKKRKRHKMATHKRKKRLRKNRHKKK
jgi:cytochrome c